jgi:dolichol-phosphate mannosyltransferase
MPFKYTVVVVDDGSKDRTAEIAREYAQTMPLKLVQHEVNKGLGEGIQTGLREGWLIGDAVIVMDSDNTHNPVYIQDMVKIIEAAMPTSSSPHASRPAASCRACPSSARCSVGAALP